jgi:hypothetical protein
MQKVDEEDLVGQRFLCIAKNGVPYFNSPDETDPGEAGDMVKFNEVVEPHTRWDQWICVAKQRWLPLQDSSGAELLRPHRPERDEQEFAKKRQAELEKQLAAIDDEEASKPPETDIGRGNNGRSHWGVMDELVASVVRNDIIYKSLDRFKELREKAAVRLQAAERMRQAKTKTEKRRSSSKHTSQSSSSPSSSSSSKDKKEKRRSSSKKKKKTMEGS